MTHASNSVFPAFSRHDEDEDDTGRFFGGDRMGGFPSVLGTTGREAPAPAPAD